MQFLAVIEVVDDVPPVPRQDGIVRVPIGEDHDVWSLVHFHHHLTGKKDNAQNPAGLATKGCIPSENILNSYAGIRGTADTGKQSN